VRDRPGSTIRARVHVVEDGGQTVRRDDLATEEPLEIRIAADGRPARTVAVTMRTPGADFDLAAGFLYGEGVVAGATDIALLAYCTDPAMDVEQRYNVVTATLAHGLDEPDLGGLERHFYVSSACGVCGKATLDSVRRRGVSSVPDGPRVPVETLYRLPGALSGEQTVFARTGGLHAAGLFTADGQTVAVREDVGRHNAVDKLIGWALLSGRLPLHDLVLVVSGRASFEIVQKAAAAGVPVLCAVSAPSSLAVALAEEFGLTLVGFLRGRRCNIYAGHDRVAVPAAARWQP
jgi:FdhD protein